MGKTFEPGKYNMALCPLCKGEGRLPKTPDGFDVCKECGGFGFIKREKGGSNFFRTMLVEDNPPFRQLVKNYLQGQFPSMNITEAGDGEEAFQKVDSHAPNLILMDIKLPGENGLELTRKIKADHPNIIIIILTSYDLPEYREAAMRCKANYFLSKGSIGTGEISKLVKSILLEKGFNADGSDSKKGYS
jgi:DNA-binding NarL/FixJ family response regulator